MTAALLPNGRQQFLDDNGDPLAAGLVYFYIVGTTTPKTTWSDPAQTVPNSNPVLLDAAGEAVIYGSGEYRQVVHDVFGNLVWDEVTSSGLAQILGLIATQAEAEDGTVDDKLMSPLKTADAIKNYAFPVAPGTVELSTLQRLGEVINLKDYDLTGGSDISTALMACWAQALTKQAAQIFIPPGQYHLGNATPVGFSMTSGSSRGIDIVGAGRDATAILSDKIGDWLQIGSTANPAVNVGFGDMQLIANATQSSGAGLTVFNSQFITLKNLAIAGSRQPLKIGQPTVANDVVRIIADNIYLAEGGSSFATGFVTLAAGAEAVFSNCFFNSSGGIQFAFDLSNTQQNWDGLQVFGGTFEQQGLLNVTGKGLSNGYFSGGINDRPAANHTVLTPSNSGNIFNVVFEGWKFQGVDGANTIQAHKYSAAGGAITSLSWIGCSTWNCGSNAFFGGDGGSINLLEFLGNKVWDCGFNGAALWRMPTGQISSVGNMGAVISRSGYTYGIDWEPSSGNRLTSGDQFKGFATAAQIGTP